MAENSARKGQPLKGWQGPNTNGQEAMAIASHRKWLAIQLRLRRRFRQSNRAGNHVPLNKPLALACSLICFGVEQHGSHPENNLAESPPAPPDLTGIPSTGKAGRTRHGVVALFRNPPAFMDPSPPQEPFST